MPRDLPLGNGGLLVSFDQMDQIREVYWPHVGMESHAAGHVFRVGVWADGQFRWLSDPGWVRDLRYHPGTLVTQVRLFHPALKLTLDFSDAVDFHENLLVRHCAISDQSGQGRVVRLFFHHADTYLWQADDERFARMANRQPDGSWEIDRTVDASLAGLWRFGMYPPDDPRIVRTMATIRERLWVKTNVGDAYRQVSADVAQVPGNPWFVTTLWLAEWQAEVARTPEDLGRAQDLLKWAVGHALPSGVLAEQIHPYYPASRSPGGLRKVNAG